MKEYLSSAADVISAQKTDAEAGLSDVEAASRLEAHGLNKLKEAPKESIIKKVLCTDGRPYGHHASCCCCYFCC